MARFELSPEAFADFAGLVDYTTKTWGTAQANKYADALEHLLDQLAKFPFIGQERSELNPDLRSFPFQSHVVYYRPMDFGVRIFRVLHKSQDPALHL